MVAATRTVCIPLERPTPADHQRLQATYDRYQHCLNRVSDFAWSTTSPEHLATVKRDVEAALYDTLREETEGLHANLVQKAIKDVTSAMDGLQTQWQRGHRISKPSWDDQNNWAMTYDKRAATFSKHEVSVATVDGRLNLRYCLPADLDGTTYERYVLDGEWSYSTSKLVYRHGEYWLHLGVTREYSDGHWTEHVDDEVSDAPAEDTIRVLGVDLNVHNYTAVTSAAGFHGNADRLNHRRSRFEALRGELQQTATRSAYQRFQQRRGVEAAWFDEYAHGVANGIIDDALEVKATHVVFEDLEGIRNQMDDAPKYQQWLFERVQSYVAYKCKQYGICVETVDPANTSRQCSHTVCGHVSSENRTGRDFECERCGLLLNADYNAARNIGLRYLEAGTLPSSRTRSTGKATCQLALVSGTLSPGGTFIARDWVSTDKPTASAVGS